VFKHLGNWSAVLFFVVLFLSGLGTRVIEEWVWQHSFSFYFME
jgi:hypothetical protein